MKFNEKLMKFRKAQGMSQEELGEKLNVTRQTVSKWELGDTTPEMDKLIEISKLFNVTVDELTNDEEIKQYNNYDSNYKADKDNSEGTNWKAIIIIIVLIIALIGAVYFLAISFIAKKAVGTVSSTFDYILGKEGEVENDKNNLVGKFFDFAESMAEEIDEQYNNKNNKSEHNSAFENSYTGVKSGFIVKSAINQVITINQKGDKKITVIYENINTQDNIEIANIINNLSTNKDYLITYDYDADGYICIMNISNI